MKINRKIVLAFGFFLVVFFLNIVYAGDTTTVEANIFALNGSGNIIRVEVPDDLFFGNISKGGKSDELKVYVNNTGTVDIIVTPDLINNTEKIFKNLYFRKFKTSNGTAVPFSKIGNFDFEIKKPISGGVNDEYFYVMLDLSNYTDNIDSNMIGHKANVKFFAVAK